jgi:uncharacterized ion transporter superfamily protein YfcC
MPLRLLALFFLFRLAVKLRQEKEQAYKEEQKERKRAQLEVSKKLNEAEKERQNQPVDLSFDNQLLILWLISGYKKSLKTTMGQSEFVNLTKDHGYVPLVVTTS